MLKPVTFDHPQYVYCWLNYIVALDEEHGAYLLISNGRSRGVVQVYWLIVKGPMPLDQLLLGGAVKYRRKLRMATWQTIYQVIDYANDVLAQYASTAIVDHQPLDK